ncbi:MULTISPECIES: hypothetical protein [Deinococcus]|uniref:Uncharacterized protein n=1 Tax=Deinococcus ruber TaxID=1848197 RepID=A0A918CD28_9DEIO|nr:MULTISPECIES: hypothetical protein [Deinococcus]ULH17373.1 hypothetical protein MF271_19475 [Deinococcus sp. KNUC1210]GGR16620.1 hypothetical protein GCM10008957_31580 [Deinococcus ruber]
MEPNDTPDLAPTLTQVAARHHLSVKALHQEAFFHDDLEQAAQALLRRQQSYRDIALGIVLGLLLAAFLIVLVALVQDARWINAPLC